MKQSLVKLVDVILRRIEESPHRPHSERGLRRWLLGQGYKKGDIDAAMKLIGPRFEASTVVEEFRPGSIRTLSAEENLKLSPEARLALSRLDYYGLLTAQERELILEQVNEYDGEVGMEELDYLLSWTLCSTRDVESQQLIYGLIEGQGELFH